MIIPQSNLSNSLEICMCDVYHFQQFIILKLRYYSITILHVHFIFADTRAERIAKREAKLLVAELLKGNLLQLFIHILFAYYQGK